MKADGARVDRPGLVGERHSIERMTRYEHAPAGIYRLAEPLWSLNSAEKLVATDWQKRRMTQLQQVAVIGLLFANLN